MARGRKGKIILEIAVANPLTYPPMTVSDLVATAPEAAEVSLSNRRAAQ